MLKKNFITISSEIYKNKLVLINTSIGRLACKMDGLSFDEIIDFLFSLRHEKEPTDVFVCYAFQSDNEFIFSQLSSDVKDKLFQSQNIRASIDELEIEQDELNYQYFKVKNNSQQFQELDFNKYVNKLALKDLFDVKYNGYDIRLINGKLLTITKNKESFLLYDVYGFFRTSLRKAVSVWLDESIPLLNKNKRNLKQGIEEQQLKAYSNLECKYITKLVTKLNLDLLCNDIRLTKFHGATAVSSWLLSKTKARKEYKNYRYRRQLGTELHKAVTQAYYGGRIEQLKIGTFNEKVNVYDINSAYAHACCFLPILLRKPVFTRNGQILSTSFSLSYIEYDFSNDVNIANNILGVLPNRKAGNGMNFALRGKGYFWQPEVQYVLNNYPDCVEIKHGYYVEDNPAKFTKEIQRLYELRLKLQEINHPLEKIIKLGLAAIYGKFGQRDGKAYYYNLMYAGYITSFTRAQMLEAVKGNEEHIICLLTDAIHTTKELSVEESNKLGAWKKTEYTKAQYLDSGVYRLYDDRGQIVKEKSKGFRTFRFNDALQQLQQERVYTGLAEFFIGHNLYSFMPIRFNNYLQLQQENKQTNPFELGVRLFETMGIDFTKEHCSSKVIDFYNGRESGLYRTKYFRESDFAKDALIAERL